MDLHEFFFIETFTSNGIHSKINKLTLQIIMFLLCYFKNTKVQKQSSVHPPWVIPLIIFALRWTLYM
jgi:hypothetical protein